VHLVDFIIRIYHDARSPERQIGIIIEGTDTTLHRSWRVINGSDRQTEINLYNYIKMQFPDKRGNYILKENCKATRIKQTAFVYEGEW